jgi:hypothetical protein
MVGTFKGRNKPSCIYAWTHMKKEKERKISKDGERNGKKKGYETTTLLWNSSEKRRHERLALLLQA